MILGGERISVVVPVFNGEGFLGEAVASIVASGIAPSQIVIVDDGSTDGTPDVIAGLGEGIRAIRQANRGPAAARNRGIERADGDLIAFLDADDLWGVGHPAGALAHFREAGDVDLVLGRTQCMRWDAESDKRPRFCPWKEPFHLVNVGSWLCRRELFDRVGLFDERLRHGEDLDWFLRAREWGARIVRIDDVCLLYRLRPAAMQGTRGAGRGGLLAALHQSIGRRRANRMLIGDVRRAPGALRRGGGT